jgi:hypothetical protein
MDGSREWLYFSYHLDEDIPGYNTRYYNGTTKSAYWAFGGRNGVYGVHGLRK